MIEYGYVTNLLIFCYVMNARNILLTGILIVLFSAFPVYGEYRFGDGQLEISDGETVDSISGESGVEEGAAVAGGGNMAYGANATSSIASSSATLNGGTIYGILIGGSYAKDGATAIVDGNSSANMLSGTIDYKTDTAPYDPTILGGGFAHSTEDDQVSSKIGGNSSVNITGGYAVYAVAGGAAQSDNGAYAYNEVAGQSLLTMSGGHIWGAYGGGWALGANSETKSLGGAKLEFTGGVVDGNIFGGTWTSDSKGALEGGSLVVIDGSTVGGSVLGGGESADGSLNTVTGGAAVQMKFGSVAYLYGGAANWSEQATQNVSVDMASVEISGGTVNKYVVGGGYYANVDGLAKVTISGGEIKGNIYGGSEGVSSVGSTQVEITGGSLSGNVYGGGWGANTVVEGESIVNVNSAIYINQIAGGGLDGAEIKDSTNVTLDGGASSYWVMGGGEGDSLISGGTNVTIKNASVNSLNGGGYVHSGAKEIINGNINVTTTENADFSYSAGMTPSSITGGSYVHGENSSSNINGNIILDINGTSPAYIYAGSCADTKADAVVNGDINSNVSSGQIYCFIGGNYAINEASSTLKGNAVSEINNASVNMLFNGDYAYNGASSTIDGNVSAKLSGVNVVNYYGFASEGEGNVYGGSVAASDSTAVLKGSSSIEIAGTNISGNVYAGGFTLDDASSSVIEKSAEIKISSGVIGGDIYAGGSGKLTSVRGDSNIVFAGSSEDISFTGTVYGGGQNGGTVEGSSNLVFGDSSKSFSGTFDGKLSEIDIVEVKGASDVKFMNAFDVDRLLVGSTSKVSLIEETSFNSISIIFEDNSFSSGEEFEFNLDNIFSDSTIVLAALENGNSFTVFDSNGNEWNANYETGSIQIGSAVPEPAANAAIFGALAIAFAMYCRRK